ncbi:hypothetical protein P280DRAFT_408336, partial [Massarina eburnea CBS 473.64]
VAMNVYVTPEEERYLGGGMWLDPETGMHIGLVSVLHDLHCVNMLRKAMYPDYYSDMKDATLQPHLEHCVDALRLSLMCAGDMTLIPTVPSNASRPFEALFETTHTCRDFDALKEWAISRDAADSDYIEKARTLQSNT